MDDKLDDKILTAEEMYKYTKHCYELIQEEKFEELYHNILINAEDGIFHFPVRAIDISEYIINKLIDLGYKVEKSTIDATVYLINWDLNKGE